MGMPLKTYEHWLVAHKSKERLTLRQATDIANFLDYYEFFTRVKEAADS